MTAARPMPMFPLGSVVFPATYLPLHVFEERYRRLTRDCLDGDREFGVVLIERGHEVGGGDVRTDVGTVVQIVAAEEAPDGRWALGCLGVRRLRVVHWLADDPYPRAEVEELAEGTWTAAADAALAEAERHVRRSFALRAELDEPAPPIDVELSPDPSAAAWQLASLAPIGPLDQQLLLTVDDPADRLRLLATMTDEACAVLAQRLAGF
jgi:Lon protease-like protein